MDYISGATASNEKIAWMEQHVPTGSGTALDMGCGAGFYTEWLVGKGWKVEALDLNPAISIAGARIQKHNLEEGLPFQNQTFHAMLAWDVIEHIQKEDFILKEISRTLRPGGVLIGSVPHRDDERLHQYNLSYKHHIDKTHQREYTIQDLRTRLREHGFGNIITELKGPVSPQVISEFVSVPALRKPVRLMVGAARRMGILNFGNLYGDIFFVARKQS